MGLKTKNRLGIAIWSFVIFYFTLHVPSYAQPYAEAKFGKGLKVTAADSSFSIKISPRFQTMYEGNLNLNSDDWEEKLIIRRARLKLEGFAFDPSLEYKIELAFSNRDIGKGIPQTNNAGNILLEAVVKWNFYKNLELWVGQTKLPGNRERVMSSQNLQLVDRSILNSYFNLDRDIGLQLRNKFNIQDAVFKQAVSMATGEGKNITTNNAGGRNYTFRLEALPFGEFKDKGDYSGADLSREDSPKLAIGVSYDLNKQASRENGQSGSFLEAKRDLHTLFVDGMFKYKGSSLMFEYATKTATDGPVLAVEDGEVTQSFATGSGLNLQAGYLFKNDFEVSARYSQVTPHDETQRNKEEEYTLGLSKYISGHNLKVQGDVSVVQEQGMDNHLRFRLQMEIGL